MRTARSLSRPLLLSLALACAMPSAARGDEPAYPAPAPAAPDTATPDGEKPRVATALREQADELRDYLAIATLQPIAVERPADCVTDLARGADAAESLGMNRLATRLRGVTDPSQL